ncbi:N-acetylglucosamine kinase [Nonomuraea guangzhouensis]|uniref:N-acetylglucosamine kinase n=1 Tax=Nonomuraea guangzhouensis TaxID=1291555 RepID=A0ABW4GIT8_9ACTN|nr:BadF/BadG/BcrA/BcrD ATPase family protein [Nonomuraea guangzhouensis]
MTVTLVLGMDIGGTSSRALVADVEGHVRGAGQAGGGNPISRGLAGITAIRDALRAATAGVDPADIKAAVFGLAGGEVAMRTPEIVQALETGWRQAGLLCTPAMVSDVTLAYVSGTDAADGTVVVSGTGAVAAAIRDRTVMRAADGHGWLLGDHGSGFWIGREAVRAVLITLDRDGSLSELNRQVLRDLGVPDADRLAGGRTLTNAIIETAHRIPPPELARLAPLVLTAADGGDQEATLITRRAADHLTASVNVIRQPGATSPIVLGGSLLTTPNPLSRALRTSLGRTWPDTKISTSGEGAAAAAWLASRHLPDISALASRQLYTRLLTTKGS